MLFSSSLLRRENSSTLCARVLRQYTYQCYRYPIQRSSPYIVRPRFQSTVTRNKYFHNAALSSRVCLPAMGLALRAWHDGHATSTDCEAPESVVMITSTETVSIQEPTGWKSLRRKILKAFRLWRRFVKLLFTLAPVAALYPLQKLLGSSKSKDENVHDVMMVDSDNVEGPLGWYLRLCLYCVECSGAAVVKLMQWAGSRPDLFGQDFCAVFSRLQDDTTPHSWRYTEKVMRKAYGNDWKDRIQLGNVIGSGCIGQVYDGTIKDAAGEEQRVAVKGW